MQCIPYLVYYNASDHICQETRGVSVCAYLQVLQIIIIPTISLRLIYWKTLISKGKFAILKDNAERERDLT